GIVGTPATSVEWLPREHARRHVSHRVFVREWSIFPRNTWRRDRFERPRQSEPRAPRHAFVQHHLRKRRPKTGRGLPACYSLNSLVGFLTVVESHLRGC